MNKIKLFAVPYAGGSALAYEKWRKNLNKDIKLISIELPGRGYRSKEKLCETMKDLIADVILTISGNLDTEDEYALYGHSMGALIIYEVYFNLKKLGYKLPKHMFFSGNNPPNRQISQNIDYKNLSLKEFKEEVFQYESTPKEIFEKKELRDYFIPILRSDYMVIENFSYKEENTKLECDITVINGKDDNHIKLDQLGGWLDLTKGICQTYFMEGKHFFLFDNEEEINEIINKTLIARNILNA
ncbi:thioesterase II family protein [Clostridium sp. LP20]|uniref:thioesterase II family protein n=1 Tax=Clostridium sp. LP20 TaxID=3418665 RepID=UPI003EE78347